MGRKNPNIGGAGRGGICAVCSEMCLGSHNMAGIYTSGVPLYTQCMSANPGVLRHGEKEMPSEKMTTSHASYNDEAQKGRGRVQLSLSFSS